MAKIVVKATVRVRSQVRVRTTTARRVVRRSR